MKISEKFELFIDSPESGTGEIISELNSEIANGHIETETMLNEVGEDYFHKCMELAINVIKSFEAEEETLRPKVDWFAELMMDRLEENSYKDEVGWKNLTDRELEIGLITNQRKLEEELHLKEVGSYFGSNEDIIQHATDVANYAMMLADNHRDEENEE